MFRIVLECKTFNCDKLLGNIIDMVKQMQGSGLLSKIPGAMKIPSFIDASMFQNLPDSQKIPMFEQGLSKEKARILPMLENALSEKIGKVHLLDFGIQYIGTENVVAKIRVDAEILDYNQVIDILVENYIEEASIEQILQDQYDETITMENMDFFMKGQSDETKEYLIVKSMSIEKQKLMRMLENFAESKEVEMKLENIRFFMRESS
jgi:hypothetical protein